MSVCVRFAPDRFSDPLADGPVNQMAAERALKSGTTLRGVLDLVAHGLSEQGDHRRSVPYARYA